MSVSGRGWRVYSMSVLVKYWNNKSQSVDDVFVVIFVGGGWIG